MAIGDALHVSFDGSWSVDCRDVTLLHGRDARMTQEHSAKGVSFHILYYNILYYIILYYIIIYYFIL